MPIANNPRVVVTGGGSGLGRAIALHFAARGGSILVSDVNVAGAEETVALVRAKGAEAHAEKCDVAKSEDVERARDVARERFGGVDVVVNNAGVAVAGPVGDVPLRDWEWILGVNLWGVIYGCHHFLPMFKKQGSGHIINVASAAGLAQAPEMAPYNVTKSAVISLIETLASELAGTGVGVTVVCPSFFQTNLMSGSRNSGMKGAEERVAKLMRGSKVQAEDVARIAIEAASENELYAIPHLEARAIWAVKRIVPGTFHQVILPRVARKFR